MGMPLIFIAAIAADPIQSPVRYAIIILCVLAAYVFGRLEGEK